MRLLSLACYAVAFACVVAWGWCVAKSWWEERTLVDRLSGSALGCIVGMFPAMIGLLFALVGGLLWRG
jgi:hypothetical protein